MCGETCQLVSVSAGVGEGSSYCHMQITSLKPGSVSVSVDKDDSTTCVGKPVDLSVSVLGWEEVEDTSQSSSLAVSVCRWTKVKYTSMIYEENLSTCQCQWLDGRK